MKRLINILVIPVATTLKSLTEAARFMVIALCVTFFLTSCDKNEIEEPKSVVASGTTGNLTWKFTADGTLTISGTGAMPDYTGWYDQVSPWREYTDEITNVLIGDNVRGCQEITIPI